MAAKEQVKMYLRLAKEQVSHAIGQLYNIIKYLKKQVEEKMEHLDHKDEITIHKDKIRLQ